MSCNMRILFNWLVTTAAVLVTAYVLPGVTVAGFVTALVVAVVLGMINMFLRPLLLVLTLPVNVMTLGLFTLVINAALVLLAARIVPGFVVAGFWWALLFSLVLTLVQGVFNSFASRNRAA